MKLINKAIYALSVAGMMGLWSCSSEEAMPDVNVASGERVPITIVVSREGDSGTRTELSEDLQNGGLTHTWSAGDELFLYDSNGADAGKVTLESGEGSAKGVFKGEVTATSGEYCLWYFGSKQPAASDADLAGYPYVTVSGGQVTLDLKTPKFETAADFSKVDVMSQKATINVNGNQATVAQTVTMQPHVALARFDLRNLPAGVTGTLKVYDTKAQTEGNINTKQILTLSDGSVVRSEETEAYTFTDWSSDKNLYVAFVPYSSNLKFEYTYQKEVQEVVNGATVKNTYPIKNIHSFKENQNLVAGIYYQSVKTVEGSQAPTIGGVEVPFEIDDSDNPGNMDFWVLDDVDPDYTKLEDAEWTTDNMWTVNCRNQIHTGGFGHKITYLHNGIKSGILASSFDASCTYFQWGRWLGFPIGAVNIRFNWNGVSTSFKPGAEEIIFLPGIQYAGLNTNIKSDDESQDEDVAYLYLDFPATYGGHPMGGNSTWTKQNAIDYSIFFGMTKDNKLDYIYANENCSWEDRSGNPCPDGTRVPTEDELECLVPPIGKFTGSCVDFKTIKGIRYAMKWSVNTRSSVKCIEIRSFMTDVDKVDLNDDRFNNSKVLVLPCNGYLNNIGDYYSKNVIGTFWSSDTGRLSTGYLGGVYLYIEINGSGATMQMDVAGRVYGFNVIPVKDKEVKSSTLTPILPLNVYHGEKCPYW